MEITMKLGYVPGYAPDRLAAALGEVVAAEELGFDSVWTSEAYGGDALTPAAWFLARTSRIKVGTAILQVPARTPACTAMSAMSLDMLSGGRFILGLGPSGPQVVEGWHGVPFGKPLTRMREYITVLRKIFERDAPVNFSGEYYQLPYAGAGASGLGKALRSILPAAPKIPIYTAAIAPAGVRTAAELADGLIPVWMDPTRFDLFRADLDAGFAAAGYRRSPADFAMCPFVAVALGDDVAACRDSIKQFFGFYIGGMGARAKNFYNDYARRLGYADAAARIQELFLAGRRAEAIAAVPDALVDACALAGPAARIRERLAPWREAAARGHVDTMIVQVYAGGRQAMQVLAESLL
ncbi:MAG: LLM class F420-dependent oxidoreductase [Gammaproteobacteria bacterium]